MAKKEKFGKFVLLDEVESSGLGSEYRAAKLGSTGFEKIVALLRLGPELSKNANFAKNLMDQAKLAAQLQNPNISRIYGIGKVDAAYYISYEFVEGKSLKGILARCRLDGFPFSVDHTLLIASKICSALEYAHGRKTEAGVRYYHGLVNPGSVFVSYEGEVRLRGFGYWPSKLREAAGLRDDETLYLAPEQASGGMGDTRSDIFAVGAILFETLTGQPLFQGGRLAASAERLAGAKLQSSTGDDDSLPKPIAEILGRSLAADPAGRYAETAEMRKAIDTLLFSGDFTPTTFNLAFFMHSLFREDIDKESKLLKEEKEASYFEFLTDDTTKLISKATAQTVSVPTPASGAPSTTAKAETHPPMHTPVPVSAPAHEPAPAPSASAKEAAAGFTFHKDEPNKSSAPMLAGGVLVALLLAGAGWVLFGSGAGGPANTGPPATTISAEAIAAQQKVKELEDKLRAFEEQKAAAEALAAEEAKKQLEAQAKALGTTADPAAIAKAQEAAAKKARLEQERKQQEEKKKLEAAKAAEEARLADEQRKAEAARAVAAAAVAAATTTLPPTTTVPPTTQAAVKPGALVNLADTGVTPPVPDKTPPLAYPPIALRQRIEGAVELSVLVDDRGVVAEVQVVTSAGGRAGLDEAAVENAKKRKYRPATKDGVPVKVWMPLRVQFRLPS